MSKNFDLYIREQNVDEGFAITLKAIFSAVKDISKVVKSSGAEKAGSENASGEDQLALDLIANQFVVDHLRSNGYVGLIASEEMEDEEKISDGPYAVCFDPLDGSSLVDSNLALGSIFGIYKTDTFMGITGDEQVASLIAVYGPRTTIMLTIKNGVVEFMLDKEEFVFVRDGFEIKSGKMFAPGNLRACTEREDYLELVNYWCREGYTLRYSGGMVPDINQILVKGKGIFSYPGYSEANEGKLRLLFECSPISLLIEQAGGASTDGMMRILDKPVGDLHQRTPIFAGSNEEVDRCQEFLF